MFETLANAGALERYFAASSNKAEGLESGILEKVSKWVGGGQNPRFSSSIHYSAHAGSEESNNNNPQSDILRLLNAEEKKGPSEWNYAVCVWSN